jgi:hypothetical protein
MHNGKHWNGAIVLNREEPRNATAYTWWQVCEVGAQTGSQIICRSPEGRLRQKKCDQSIDVALFQRVRLCTLRRSGGIKKFVFHIHFSLGGARRAS